MTLTRKALLLLAFVICEILNATPIAFAQG
jgi:hypothetical protein